MIDLIPQQPHRPLMWPDIVLDLQDLLVDYPQPIYIVGGAVRDALMGRPLTDLDLAVADLMLNTMDETGGGTPVRSFLP